MDPEPELLFEALTPLGFSVRVTCARWSLITTMKHPVMVGQEDAVRRTLENPEEVRRSQSDPEVLLFYRYGYESLGLCGRKARD